ncbi:hypothetical protein BDC45DRAFT_572229 [Circinella umbellata]|nr:hypothetical protein BDC45DRAFT_572229 [Circinella umbellata]
MNKTKIKPRTTMLSSSSSSQSSIQNVDFNQLRYGLSLDNGSHQSISRKSTTSTCSLGKQSERSTLSSDLKKKSKSPLDRLKKQNSPGATGYQAKADYLLFRK